MNKYIKGDKVRVVNYGNAIFINGIDPVLRKEMIATFPVIKEKCDGCGVFIDIASNLIGKKGVIDKIQITQGVIKYSLSGIPDKSAWYNEDQLELVKGFNLPRWSVLRRLLSWLFQMNDD